MDNYYEKMLHLPHPASTSHPHMPTGARAAQFLPFSALAGYQASVEETARLTEQRMELPDEIQMALSKKIQLVHDLALEHPSVAITYFVPDKKKEGGRYVEATGTVKKVDPYERKILFMDGTQIPFGEIVAIESHWLGQMEL